MTALDPNILSRLCAIVGAQRVLDDRDSLVLYGQDWTRVHEPAPVAVVLPGTIEEVQAVVRLAAQERLALVPSGGRTGLAGGAVASAGELVLALDRLDWLQDFNPVDRTVRCGAGVITATLQQYAQDRGLFYPVDFAASGSSQIGGNIATNAGGIRVTRYGMTREWVAGLKLVTGTGELLDLNRGLVKNNAGYDLRQLVIGAEGTLGVVVEATLRLARTPVSQGVMVLGTPGMQPIMDILAVCQERLQLSAFEFFSNAALDKVVEHSGLRRPFDTASEYYALLEFDCPDEAALEQAMGLFEHCVEAGWVLDGTIAQTEAQAHDLWRLREDISETLSRWTPWKNDISTLVSLVPALLEDIERLVSEAYPDFEIIWYGHIGDGNIHLNVLKPDALSQNDFQQRCAAVSPAIFEAVRRHGGSVSAEHGVGLLKKDYLTYTRSEAEVELMRQIKRAFDPHGIMNPGKIFD